MTKHLHSVVENGRGTEELDRANAVSVRCRVAFVDLLGKKHHAVSLVRCVGTIGAVIDDQSALEMALIDVVEPLLPLLVDCRLEAPSIDVDTFIPLDVDVAALGHVVAVVACPLVRADLVALGLGIDRRGESREQSAQYERSKAHHGEVVCNYRHSR
jgi:hypothetical protein